MLFEVYTDKKRSGDIMQREQIIYFVIYENRYKKLIKLFQILRYMNFNGYEFKVSFDYKSKLIAVTSYCEAELTRVKDNLLQESEEEIKMSELKILYRQSIKKTVNSKEAINLKSKENNDNTRCDVIFEPLQRGGGYDFVNNINRADVPNKYIDLVNKGIKHSMLTGARNIYPVVDIKATLNDITYEESKNSSMEYKVMGFVAFDTIFNQSEPVLLEPIMEFLFQGNENKISKIIKNLKGIEELDREEIDNGLSFKGKAPLEQLIGLSNVASSISFCEFREKGTGLLEDFHKEDNIKEFSFIDLFKFRKEEMEAELKIFSDNNHIKEQTIC
jgi:translation elongation factor EF-G